MEEMLSLTEEEFYYWIAYFKVKAEKDKQNYGRSASKNNNLRNR
jgi:hypothetical protein